MRRALFEQEQDLLLHTHYDCGYMEHSSSCCPNFYSNVFVDHRQPIDYHDYRQLYEEHRQREAQQEGHVSSTEDLRPIREIDETDNDNQIKDEEDEDEYIDITDYHGEKIDSLKTTV